MPLTLLLIPVVFVLVGGTFVVVSLRSRGQDRRFLAGAERATGVVTENRRIRPRSYDAQAHAARAFALLRLTLPDGSVVETLSDYGTPRPVAQPGDTVSVLYDPANPRRARVEGHAATPAFFTGCFVIFGTLFVIAGLVIAVVMYFARGWF
jgi:Protein of unknown function (DUF3592)